ncbi:MAG TPA: 4-hydroxythreonine-4-phosphate dehydrogenase PdxA [Bacteroidetes bacterium]|uniref:4-hydroxythreonine-4-phosphate dehydrogenase PdxA n=1 Tax=candidate division TA06 bacterium TaxID=2250710 RepID=A0A660S6K5_UNCT6|nr:MAG: 4-hydroxythreonine-4-phosphate dehydrogenase PdxA [candidate division TA06 bacterium]HHD83112.1 4-hydroxythreonine-4-phosphate dehydrogenase PdxA [Bacteroidota bacterium]
MSDIKPRIAITCGDPAGIGPEVVIKAIADKRVLGEITPIIIAPEKLIVNYAKSLNIELPEYKVMKRGTMVEENGDVYLIDIPTNQMIIPGKISEIAGKIAYKAILISYSVIMEYHMADAVVTAPINKYSMNMSGHHFAGHTELYSDLSGKKVAMMMVHNNFRVALATNHVAVKDISAKLSPKLIFNKLKIIDDALKNLFNIEFPKIAVTGLNPHCGDNGLFGNEEKMKIVPGITLAKEYEIDVEGPFSADSLFLKRDQYDAILAMYHDQALVPFKLLSFNKGVNVTLGLPIIRTSPDHGTAFDIAGKGVADPESMIQAILIAREMLLNSRGEI